MKFTVREGFVIHDTRIVDQGGKKVEQTNSYYENDDVDFDDTTALKHLHKLEPGDKAATKFCSDRFAPAAAPMVPGGIDPATMATLIAQAVAAAMAAQAAASAPAAPAA